MLASSRRFAVVPNLRHWRPSQWANTESSRITVAECFGCRISIIANWQCSIASARQPRAVFTSTPSTSSSPGTAPSLRLAFNRIVVVRYRMHLESRGLAANTINQQLAAVRRLAHEAADSGLLSPELAAGISRVKGRQATRVSLRKLAERRARVLKYSTLLVEIACEPSATTRCWPCCLVVVFADRNLWAWSWMKSRCARGHWAVVDLIGKGGHIRTVPIPQWVKAALDQWIEQPGSRREGSFEPSPERERCGEKASRRMSCGT